jgi:hypothetical protein
MKQPAHAEIAAELTGVLAQLGDALAAADLEGLLTSETGLSTVATQLSRLLRLTLQEREALRPELERARVALARCERLGVRLHGLTKNGSTTGATGYTRRGSSDAGRPTSQMEAKV